ncbi:beta-ketoacyl synthase N-terminal-like domain-containing protein [Streptomyces sp. NPDC048057]|uniref:type I polyketide synthase n=1 Tax=Streptomyces sp. NPDC048057 TaxID=3155628 RepID=UPI0033E6FD41
MERDGSGVDDEAVAIIGMGCRFPGDADSPDAFWKLLVEGRDGIRDGGARWEPYAAAGQGHAAVVRSTTSRGGYLPDEAVAGFDAEFFGVSPREAELMDPQQRLLLELAWEALEHAGVPPLDLAGGDCGVFVGVGSDDYGRRLLEDLPGIEPWTGIGASPCATANRISHALDLRGPSLAVDTACSSSLVAVHLARRSLLSGESDVALAAGVNLVLAPGLSVTLDRAGATSPDGRSKPFDASADGYGRGEGAGVLVLKRLVDAERAGDRVLAVVRGSAVRQDGLTEGIMAPNGAAQADLLRRTYERCGVDPTTVDYVEAHGTGTMAGDPLEAGALAAVFGAGRPSGAPCLIGSVKGNIGHLEAGSGIAGMIKTVLALVHEEIPPTARFTTPHPGIPWADAGLRVCAARTPWPRGGLPRRAGVSSFGYGGTIAHVVLEEAPVGAARHRSPAPSALPAAADVRSGSHGSAAPDESAPSEGRSEPQARPGGAEPDPGGGAPWLLPLSARSQTAVRADAARLADWLAGPGAATPLDSLVHTLGTRRSHLDHRIAVLATDREDLVASLRAVASDQAPPTVAASAADGAGPPAEAADGVVWLFSGTGAQWPGMGRDLLAEDPVFAAAVDRLDPVLAEEIGTTARHLIEEGDVSRVEVAQTLIYVVQMGLVAVWESLGVRPAAVLGHSLGEIAAAVTAGVLSLEDGARLVCRRSQLLRRVAGAGAMVLVGLDADEAYARCVGHDGVVPAVLASPTTTVLAGPVAGIDALVAELAATDPELLVRRVSSDVAFHSPQMVPLAKELAFAAADLTIRPPEVPVYGTALHDPRDRAPRDGSYWATNLRNPVRLSEAVAAAAEDGFRTYLEVSAHPVVQHSVQETLDAFGAFGHDVVASVRRNAGRRGHLLANAGTLYCRGVPLAWPPAAPDTRLLSLPPRSWRRRRFWRETSAPSADRERQGPAYGTVLGSHTALPGTTPLDLWRTQVVPEALPYPGSHTIQGVEVVPAAVLLQTFLTATGSTLREVSFRLPLTLDAARDVDVTVQDGVARVLSRPTAAPEGPSAPGDGRAWPTHAAASVAGDDLPPDPRGPARPYAPEERTELAPGQVLDDLASVGVPTMAFLWQVVRAERVPDGLRVEVLVPEGDTGPQDPGHSGAVQGSGDAETAHESGRPADARHSDPSEDRQPSEGSGSFEQATGGWAALFDAALSTAAVAFPGPPALRVVAGVDRVWTTGAPPADARIEVYVGEGPGADGTADVRITAPDGRTVAVLTGVRFADGTPPSTPEELLYRTEWQPLLRDGAPPDGRPLVLVGPDGALAHRLRTAAEAAGRACSLVDGVDATGPLPAPVDVVVLPSAAGQEEAADTVREAAAAEAWLLARTAQHLLSEPPGRARLWSLTCGGQAPDSLTAVAQAARWGLGRIVGGEHPELWGGTVDLGARWTDEDLAVVLDVLARHPGEDVVAVRDGDARANRLVRADAVPERPPLRCRPDGTYLITGGLGVLGGEVARWLVDRGARRLVLVSRRGLPPRPHWATLPEGPAARAVATVRGLEALGATVRVLALDVADEAACAAALSAQEWDLPPVRGVVHAAGVLDDRLVEALDADALTAVLRPKAGGALTLHRLFPPGQLDFLVHFSSCGQLLGLTGQAAYATGNAFLDAMAAYQHAQGGTGVMSLAWTSWRGMGMADNAAVNAELAAHGVGDVSAPEAFAAWERASRLGGPALAVLRTVPLPDGARRTGLLRDVVDADEVMDATRGGAAQPPGAVGLAELPEAELRAVLQDRVTAVIAAEMRVAVEELEPDRSLMKLGLDSVMAIVIRRRLERVLERRLPVNLVWHRPTVSAVVEHLVATTGP